VAAWSAAFVFGPDNSMNEPAKLLERLDEIGRSLAETPHALALMGLGSAGQEFERMDEFSDLDFFVIVETGYKDHFLSDLSWLTRTAPVAFYFFNTVDGCKLLFEDGIFCEFAVFEPEQLSRIPFQGGRIIWKAARVPENISQPPAAVGGGTKTKEWLLGEALTNLYVGLGRELRGEKLSATRFIQGYAVDRITELSAYIESSSPVDEDPFDPVRRYEFRYPSLASYLPEFLQGYNRNRESALAIVTFVDYYFEVDPALKAAIMNMLES
jgi:hypothetical protein